MYYWIQKTILSKVQFIYQTVNLNILFQIKIFINEFQTWNKVNKNNDTFLKTRFNQQFYKTNFCKVNNFLGLKNFQNLVK